MTLNRLVITSLLIAAAGLLSSPSARADEWDRKTIVTFREPFRIPGHTLPSGNYVFKRADVDTLPNLVQIYDAHERHLLATVLAMPDYLTRPVERAEFLMSPKTDQEPETLRDWCYPGDTVAEQFIYPHAHTEQLARVQQ
jgi:hypothetical protein